MYCVAPPSGCSWTQDPAWRRCRLSWIPKLIVGLRILARGLLHRLSEAYLQASRRLARLIQDEDRISAASGISDIAKSLLQTLDEIAASEEDPPCSPGILE